MNSLQFKEWFDYLTSRIPVILEEMVVSEIPTDEILERWEFNLVKVPLSNAMNIVNQMIADNDACEWHEWGQRVRKIFDAQTIETKMGQCLDAMVRPGKTDGCKKCCDTGNARIVDPRLYAEVRSNGYSIHGISLRTVAIPCSCRRGDRYLRESLTESERFVYRLNHPSIAKYDVHFVIDSTDEDRSFAEFADWLKTKFDNNVANFKVQKTLL